MSQDNHIDHETAGNSGSRWHRWEPHIHAPGTVLNDQFKGADVWERYLTALELAEPPIRALGITDYYSLDCYEKICAAKAAGRLSGCALIFANIEMRLGLGTVKGQWVNVHLLVSPDDPDHVAEAKRFLARLTFKTSNDTFACSPADLTRLGREADRKIVDERAAIRMGTEQFKVSLEQLREEMKASAWAQANILVAVAGGDDGSSGLRQGADATLRREVERFAHIVFASSPAQRDFWLGLKAKSAEEIITTYDSLKPCLHGSDAHEFKTIGAPHDNRYTWVKGALIFDALRQSCIDPAGRAAIGSEPPFFAMPTHVVSCIDIVGATWAVTPRLHLNPGLIAVIGARGSGKTALADIIASGCDALPEVQNERSFLYRARDYLGNTSVRLDWQSGAKDERGLDGHDGDDRSRYPRARYLSQQFVDELCASDGITDALLSEIKRVVFDAHDTEARDGAVDFTELLESKSRLHRQTRAHEEASLATLSERISSEIEKDKLTVSYRAQVKERSEALKRLEADRAKLVSAGSKERVAQLEVLNKAAGTARQNVRFYAQQEQHLQMLQDAVRNIRDRQAPELLRTLRTQYPASGLKDDDWKNFLLRFAGDVDAILKVQAASAKKDGGAWKGRAPAVATEADGAFIAAGADLAKQPLALLEAEITRIEKLVGVDRTTAERFAALSKKITEDGVSLDRLKEKLSDCEGARARLHDLIGEREDSYTRVFAAVLAEEGVLAGLYAPIRDRIAGSAGSLGKLSFSVKRTADVAAWASQGEALLDLRRQGPFRGRGTLLDMAEKGLRAAWERGDAAAVQSAMKIFREQHQDALLEHAPIPRTNQAEYRQWAKRFAQWLYGTDHISIRYGVDYDGVDIRKLSPGTRGIVLLLLYLALDQADDRPLIIDQPEENLDPKSIFDELVGLFLEAKKKRQVIIVTHNANLVINTDADQVIIASAGPHVTGDLPPIRYVAGGLERPDIRRAVCDILEGGEHAFKERARRLRVQLKR